MRNTLLAQRYARALYSLSEEGKEQDKTFAQLKTLSESFRSEGVAEFLFSPVVRPAVKVAALEKLTASLELPAALKNFVLLLAKKNRLGVFADIVKAFENIADESHGVTRGTVRSATALGPEERKQIEGFVSRATRKQVVLSYQVDPSLVGGLVAEVGSFTFDDSLVSHLKRMNEQLTRVQN